jgi:hypothetical protein
MHTRSTMYTVGGEVAVTSFSLGPLPHARLDVVTNTSPTTILCTFFLSINVVEILSANYFLNQMCFVEYTYS